MLRLSVPVGYRVETATWFDAFPAGTEANLVVALSRLGRRCVWLGGLPDSSLGRLVANHLRMAGVDLAEVVWSEGRLGTYFIEFAAPPRPIQVIYDRADSCAARLRPEQVNWDYLLDSRLIHLTGITPAVSASCKAVVGEAVARAKAAGVMISFDINYRQKLWSEAEARQTLLPLIQEVDLLLCGQADARRVFGCSGSPEQIVENLAEQSRARRVVVTLGDQGAIGWDGAQFYQETAPPVEVVDRIGAGDALAAGVIHGWLKGDLALGLRYGVVLAALVLSQHGDMLITTETELLSLLEDAGGGVKR
jgi:2-dehydro-3-deoxygluconokinase